MFRAGCGVQEKDMNNPHDNTQQSLEEIKRRVLNAQPVVVDNDGRLYTPDDPKIANQLPQDKTVVKPQRWF